MKKTSHLLNLIVLLALLFGAGGLPRSTMAAPTVSADLVISQIYGAGGNSGAVWKNDYIEIYNHGASPVSLAGKSLQYASAAGSGLFGNNDTAKTELPDVTLDPGQYFLVLEAGGINGVAITNFALIDPTPISMSATAGKVALANTTASLGCNGGPLPTGTPCTPEQLALIIDLVGFGTTANFFEGTGPAAAPSTTNATYRKNAGVTDTDNNANDFEALAAVPRNSFDPAPLVSSTTPANSAAGVALNANIIINFSEAVNVTGSWYQISCNSSGTHTATVSGGPQSFTLDPDPNFVATETCTVTVYAANVNDQDLIDPPDFMASNYVFSFSTPGCGGPATAIHDIQGSGLASPVDGQVRTVEAVVTASYQNASTGLGGLFIQDDDTEWDTDPTTSEGIFVQNTATPVSSGALVRVTGTVDEVYNQTVLTSASIESCGTGTIPAPQPITPPYPAAVGGVPYLERFEGMRVSLDAGMFVSEVYDFGHYGEILLSHGDRLWNPTNVVAPGAAAAAMQDDNLRNQILLDDHNNASNVYPTLNPFGGLSPSNRIRVGDTTADVITGVLNYDFSVYRIQPDGATHFNSVNLRPNTTVDNGPYLTVASFNVLNYFNGNGQGGGFPTSRGAGTLAEFNNQRAKIISAIIGLDADVMGVMELENDGYGQYSAIQDLVNGLNAAAGAGSFAFINPGVSPVGGDEITVGILYKPAVVTPVGSAAILTTGAFNQSLTEGRQRPPIAQTFTENSSGEKFTVVVNHFKSKGSCPTTTNPGNEDSGDGQGCWNLARTNAATDLAAWIANVLTASSGDPDFLVVGDLNAYAMEDPITVFKTAGYTDLDSDPHQYSYLFDGLSGRLDHALVTSSMVSQVSSVYTHHINADEPAAFDYNDYNNAALYVADPYRSADHDPTLVRLTLATYDTHADPAGVCAGHLPCFTTVQEAMAAVHSGGNVYVYQGTFDEDLNVNRPVTVHIVGDATVNNFNQGDGTLIFDGDFDLTVLGDFTRSGGTFVASNGTVTFAGTGTQWLTGATTFNKFRLNNAGGLALFGNVTVNGSFELDNGVLYLGSFNLTLGPSAGLLGTPSNTAMVVTDWSGELRKQIDSASPDPFTFPVGDVSGDAEYSPVTLNLSGVSGTGYVAVHLTDLAHPGLASTPRLTRFWALSQSGLTGFDCQATFSYTDADLDLGGADESAIYGAQRMADGNWLVGDPVNAAANTFTINTNSFSAFSGAPGYPAGFNLSSWNTTPLGTHINVAWSTTDESGLTGSSGFNIYRSTSPTGTRTKINPTLIVAKHPGQNTGANYSFNDSDIQSNTRYYYWIEIVPPFGDPLLYGPRSALGLSVYLPIISR